MFTSMLHGPPPEGTLVVDVSRERQNHWVYISFDHHCPFRPNKRKNVTDPYASDVVFGAFIGIFSALWTAALFFRDERKDLKA